MLDLLVLIPELADVERAVMLVVLAVMDSAFLAILLALVEILLDVAMFAVSKPLIF